MKNLEKNLASCLTLLAIISMCLGQSCYPVGNCFGNVVDTDAVLESILQNPFDLETLTDIENAYCIGNPYTSCQLVYCMRTSHYNCEKHDLAPYVVLESVINLACRQAISAQNTCLKMPVIQQVIKNFFDSLRQEIEDGNCSVYQWFKQLLSNYDHYCQASDVYYILDLFNARMRPYFEAAGCPVMIG